MFLLGFFIGSGDQLIFQPGNFLFPFRIQGTGLLKLLLEGAQFLGNFGFPIRTGTQRLTLSLQGTDLFPVRIFQLVLQSGQLSGALGIPLGCFAQSSSEFLKLALSLVFSPCTVFQLVPETLELIALAFVS